MILISSNLSDALVVISMMHWYLQSFPERDSRPVEQSTKGIENGVISKLRNIVITFSVNVNINDSNDE